MARAIDADELAEFPYSESAGTEEQIEEWVQEYGFYDEEAEKARRLCWKVIEGFVNVVKTATTFPQPSNEPLTPEELREMDGKPVWIEHDEDPQYNHVWMIWNNEIGFRHDLAGYNIFWRAYRYPLVGEEDNNG